MDRQVDALNNWVILDRFGGQTTLLAVGSPDDPGVSPRRNLAQEAREVLLPDLLEVLSTGNEVNRIVCRAGDEFQVTIRPIHSPDGSVVSGCYGLYRKAGQACPPVPLIGAWQWTVDRSGNNVGRNASQWDENLYRLHELEPEDIVSKKGPAGDWITRLLPYEDQARVKSVVDAGMINADNKQILLSFGAIIDPDSAAPRRKQLALTGTAMPHPTLPDCTFAYGFTREVHGHVQDATQHLPVVDSALFTRAYFELASSTVFAAIDCEQNFVFMTSPSWESQGLPARFDGNIAQLLEETDAEALRAHLHEVCTRSTEGSPRPIALRLRLEENALRLFSVRAVRVGDALPGRYVLLSLEAL